MALQRFALLAAVACVACSGGSSATGTKNTTGGNGSTSGDTVTVTVVLHGVTATETLENVAVAVAPSTIQRASATRGQLTFYENEGAAGQDENIPISVPKGQAISLFASEDQDYYDDVSTTYYSPTVIDTAVGSSAIEFVSWSAPCGSASFGDCQLSNLQSNVTVTANFQRLKALNVQAIGAGALTRTILTRPPLAIAPVITSNPINNIAGTTSIFTDSAYAEQYEVALFSGSQITLVGIEEPGSGFTVSSDGWAGGCSSTVGSTCIVKWPASPGGNFVYPVAGAVPPPQAKFQWYKCTDMGVPQVAQGANVTAPGWSCSLQSP